MYRFTHIVLIFTLAALCNVVQADIDVYEFDSEKDRQLYLDLTGKLRCPKCQNQDIAGSDAPIAKDMRRQVHKMVGEGKSDQEIVDYMVDRYTEWQRVNEQNSYHFMAPGSDPWYAQLLRSDRSAAYQTAFSVDGNTLSVSPARLKVSLGGLTAYDEAPDHHAQVFVNGQLVADRFFDGNREHDIEVELPAGLITAGQNVVRITAAGGQAAPRDLFVVDTVELGYPRTTTAHNGRLLIANFDDAGLIRADGFDSDELLTYARTADGLVRLQHTAQYSPRRLPMTRPATGSRQPSASPARRC